jgi:hypothetical protein
MTGSGQYHKVKDGDCISSIAENAGLSWETVWNDPTNAELKQVRGNPNVLFPGDRIYVPTHRPRQEAAATEQRHRFKRKGMPALLRLVLASGDKPRANESYIVEIDGNVRSGKTDAEGRIEVSIPPNAKRGKIIVGEEKEGIPLVLGGIDPVEQITGVQARLNNLGYNAGAVDGVLGPQTKAALESFQHGAGLPETGQLDVQTRSALVDKHAC